MRKNRPEYKNTKKTETASKTGANQKTYPQGKQGKGGNVDSTLQPGITAHWKTTQVQQSETERNEVSDPLEHKVSITQDIPLSRERTERD